MLLIPVTITGPVIIGGRTLGEAVAQDVRCSYMDIGKDIDITYRSSNFVKPRIFSRFLENIW